MRRESLLTQVGREWLVALCAFALVVAPFGCEVHWDWSGLPLAPGSGSDDDSTGLFINPEISDSLMVAGQTAAGDAFFVFGDRNADGTLAEVDSILVRTAQGAESFIIFELGRPIYLRGADGSTVQINYTDTSPPNLAAEVTVYDAGTGQTESTTVSIDLERTAQEMAAAIEALTNLDVNLPTAAAGKIHTRALGPLVLGLITGALITVSELLVIIMGQVMQAVFAAVSAAMQAALVAAFMPVYLFSGLLGEVSVSIGETPLLEIFVELPNPPQIDVSFD